MQASFGHPRPAGGTRRGRVSHACVACQQKKQRCDGQTPSCRNCLRANRTCISQDPATKRAHPRGYIESLEQHIAFLEGTLREIRPEIDIDRLTSLTALDCTLEKSASNKQASSERRNTSPAKDDAESGNNGDDSTSSDLSGLGLLYLRSAGGEPHYFGSSSAIAFSRMFSASLRAVRNQGPGLTMSGITDSSVLQRPIPTPVPLPDPTLTSMLCNAYFDQVHPQFPFLHRPTFMTWLDDVMSGSNFGPNANPAQLFFIYAVSKSLYRHMYVSAFSTHDLHILDCGRRCFDWTVRQQTASRGALTCFGDV